MLFLILGMGFFSAVGIHVGIKKVQKIAEASVVSALPTVQMKKESQEMKAFLEKTIKESTKPVRYIVPAKIEDEIPESGKFIGVDLDAMKVYLYEDGEMVSSLPVLSKGKPGSKWETPTGKYQVKAKGESLFSQLGQVYMPYSLHFYGNFLIHGWPHYSDGTPVAAGFSGGCIRLSNEDAKKVYQFARVNTPIFVQESKSPVVATEKKVGEKKEVPAVPGISARAYLVANLSTGEVYAEKESASTFPIASITKLMTAVVANEAMGSERKVKISKRAIEAHGDSAQFSVGEVFPLSALYYPLLMVSSNDAAVAIAETYGEGGFISLMNEKARAIGMTRTGFADPSGISSENTSTANDLFALASYLFEKKNFILDITRAPEKKISSSAGSHLLANMNVFSAEPSFVGGKTGFTLSAKETFLSVFELEKDGQKVPVAFIVLGSDDRKKDVGMLMNWVSLKPAQVASR